MARFNKRRRGKGRRNTKKRGKKVRLLLPRGGIRL